MPQIVDETTRNQVESRTIKRTANYLVILSILQIRRAQVQPGTMRH